jgi:DNA-directed RNA polymerase specialized sigma24 family protein
LERVSEPESKGLIRCLLRGMTLVEIAEAENIAVGTVKWRIHALQKKMRIRKNSSNLSAF